MKVFILALSAAGLVMTGLAPASEAGSKSYRGHKHKYAGERHRLRRYSQRDLDRLPISVTRPPGTGHYTFQGYPLWAARAHQPPWDR
ncbi:MAG: hypothetical protein KKB37_15735 [Alphaproteobacteria bacterium]|nr:hypothetical protein [Alphaproteobacteria bacterium]